MDPNFHHANCIHQSAQHDNQLPKPLKSLSTEDKRNISELCGLGGIIPHSDLNRDRNGHVRFDDSTAYISYKISAEVWLSEPQLAQKALQRCRLGLRQISAICWWLQRHEWACDHIVVIRTDFRHGFCSAAIPFSLVAQLQECVEETMSRGSLHPDVKNCRMFDTVRELLGLGPSFSLSTGYRLENAVDLCAMAVQMISVVLLSACEAHVGGLRPFFLDCPLKNICISGIDGPMSKHYRPEFHLGGLSCLGLMLGHPVMIFSTLRSRRVKEDSRLLFKTTVRHLSELWGPCGLVLGPSNDPPQRVYGIEIGGGVIFGQPRNHLHWVPGVLPDSTARILFDITGDLTIDGLFTVNQGCPSKARHSIVPRRAINQEIHELGTWDEYWTLQQIQSGFQAGQFLNATFNATWLKSASRTRKEKALEEASLSFWEQPWGLLISLCTGIARRVPLREAVAEVCSEMIDAWVEKPVEWTLSTSWGDNLVQRLREPHFRKWLSLIPHAEQVAIGRCVRYVLRKLCWTGLNSTSKLVVACTVFEDTDGCIHIPLEHSQPLATMLKDTKRSATFASLTTECVVTDQHTCPCEPLPQWRHKVPALATSVCQYQYTGSGDWKKVPTKGLEPGRLYWMGHMDDQRRLVAQTSSGQGNEIILKVANSQVPWSFYLRAYERVERMRSHYIALREQSYVGEEGAEEVLILSG